MKIYVTSLPGERLDSMAFHLAKRMFFDACGYDVFTDLSVPCCCGRPDWIDVFTEASKKNEQEEKQVQQVKQEKKKVQQQAKKTGESGTRTDSK